MVISRNFADRLGWKLADSNLIVKNFQASLFTCTGQAATFSIYSSYVARVGDVQMKESKHDRFKRLAGSRGDRLIREITLLGNLANKKNYHYEESDVEALFGPIEEELKEARAKFDPELPSSRKVIFE